MFKLYFGTIPSALSTALFLLFVLYFIITVKKPESNKKWKKAAIVTVLAGTLMSALSGIKDSTADTPAVSFKQMNVPLAVLCALGAMAIISGIAAAICKKRKSQQGHLLYPEHHHSCKNNYRRNAAYPELTEKER